MITNVIVPADGTAAVPIDVTTARITTCTYWIKVKSIPDIWAIKTVAIPCIIAVPSILIVAPTGTTKEETFLLTPKSFWTVLSVTGIVAALEDVENAKIATSLGHEVQDKYFNLLGFLEKVNVEIIETSLPNINKQVHISSLMSKSYGYGIQISPLHLAKATSVAINGGKSITPTLLKTKIFQLN